MHLIHDSCACVSYVCALRDAGRETRATGPDHVARVEKYKIREFTPEANQVQQVMIIKKKTFFNIF